VQQVGPGGEHQLVADRDEPGLEHVPAPQAGELPALGHPQHLEAEQIAQDRPRLLDPLHLE